MIKRLLGAALTVTMLCAGTPAPANPENFEKVTSRLEPGGSFYAFIETEDAVDNMLDRLSDIFEKVPQNDMSEEDLRMLHVGLDFMGRLVRVTGIDDIDALGVSTVPDGNLNRTRLFIYAPDRDSPTLKAIDAPARKRPTLNFAPADTLIYQSVDVEIAPIFRELVQLFDDAAQQAGQPPVSAQLAEIEKNVPITKMVNSIKGDITWFVAGDSKEKMIVPGPNNQLTSFPRPYMCVSVECSDNTIYTYIHDQASKNAGQPAIPLEGVDGVEGFSFAFPPGMPGRPAPTIAWDGKRLYMATHTQDLVEGLARLKAGAGGLAEQADFVAANKSLPAECNGRFYLSKRLSRDIADVVTQTNPELGTDWMNDADLEKAGIASVRVNDADGMLVTTRARQSGAVLAGALLIAPAGIVTAIAVPSFLRARDISRRNACQENLAKIDGAKQQWALENNAPTNATPSWSDLIGPTAYIRKMPICPSGGVYTLNDISHNPECSIQGGQFPHLFPEP